MEVKLDKRAHVKKKLTRDVMDLFIADVADDSTLRHAALANGFSETILYDTLRQGVLELDHGLETDNTYLVVSLYRVEQKQVKESIKLLKNNEKGHIGAQWRLEHRFWRDFSSSHAAIELDRQLRELESKQSHSEINAELSIIKQTIADQDF